MTRNGWHRALDVQMDLLKWCKTEDGLVFNATFVETLYSKAGIPIHDDLIVDMVRHVMITLNRADTIYVTADMQHVLMQAAQDLPSDVELDEKVLISPFGFAMFEEEMVGVDKHNRNISVQAISWECQPIAFTPMTSKILAPYAQGLIVYFWSDIDSMTDDFNRSIRDDFHTEGRALPPMTLLHLYPSMIGDKLPESDHPGSQLVQDVMKLFVAMQLLAQQRIGEPMVMRPDRAQRRRYGSKWDGAERVISLITLRRRKTARPDGEEPQKIEWSRRWVVQGHWRRQWYPSLKRHDWKYIYEYIKGPDDKPLVQTERRVFNFRR